MGLCFCEGIFIVKIAPFQWKVICTVHVTQKQQRLGKERSFIFLKRWQYRACSLGFLCRHEDGSNFHKWQFPVSLTAIYWHQGGFMLYHVETGEQGKMCKIPSPWIKYISSTWMWCVAYMMRFMGKAVFVAFSFLHNTETYFISWKGGGGGNKGNIWKKN